MFRKVNKYGHKNFYKQLGLSQHFTFRGLLRRTQRTYPTMFKTSKFMLIFTLVTTTSLLITPGSTLPLQATFKKYLLKKAQQICQLWFLNTGIPDQIAYLGMVYRFIFYLFDNSMNSAQNVSTYLSHINNAIEAKQNAGGITKNIIKIENIKNCILVLKKTIQHFEIIKDPNSLLKNKLMLKQYKRIIKNSVVNTKGNIDQTDKNDYSSCLKLFQYLLKFERKKQKINILEDLIKVIEDPRKKFVIPILMKQQGLKQVLKRIFNEQVYSKPLILHLLDLVDKYQKQKNIP